jgi:hypothetical protein
VKADTNISKPYNAKDDANATILLKKSQSTMESQVLTAAVQQFLGRVTPREVDVSCQKCFEESKDNSYCLLG